MIDFLSDLDLDQIEDEDDFIPVPESEWQTDLEQRVKDYMSISPVLPINEVKYKHVKTPEFKTPEEYKLYWKEEFRRCREGYNGMCGKMYFFFNYCYMENISKGRIRPEYRVIDNEWFKFIEACQKSKEWGIVCVKRRRVGASWKEAADVLHDTLFSKNYHVGMNSKSVEDSIHLFRKVKFIYNNLPAEMRVRTTSSTQMFMDFSYMVKDENGTKVKKGNNSDVFVTAPTDSAFEGRMLNKWVCDEAGKIANLPQIWSFTEDCLMQETRRAGIPIIFGTSGDVGKDGAGLREMWNNSDVYKLKRFFFAGWMGLAVDEYGNDRKEEAIRWIIYKRRKMEKLNTKFYNDFIQKYPLTVEEAFTDNTRFGLGDAIKIQAQINSLALNPPIAVRGSFKEENDTVVWIPNRLGACTIYEQPEKSLRNGYIAGCDPADIDDVTGDSSDLSTYIMALQNGTSRPRIVFEYTDRPRELNNYYYQVMLALRYYNDTRILIERQKGGRMISYLKDNGYNALLMTTPQEIKRLVPSRNLSIGIHMDAYAKEYMRGVVSEYVDDNSEIIPSIPLLRELLEYGTKNTDKAMAFGITVIALKEVSKPYLQKKKIFNGKLPNFRYIKDNTGKIVMQRGFRS